MKVCSLTRISSLAPEISPDVFLKASSHTDDTTQDDSMRHDPFFPSPYN